MFYTVSLYVLQERSVGVTEAQLQEVVLKCQQQAEQLISQQIRVEELEAALKVTQCLFMILSVSVPMILFHKETKGRRTPQT